MSRISFCLSVASLAYRLLLPLGLMRLLVMLSVLAWFTGALLQWWFPGWGWLKVVATLGMLLVTFLLLVALPSQVTALASSRQVSLLGNFRRFLLLFQFGVGVLISFIAYWTISGVPAWSTIPAMLLVIWLMTSLLIQVNQVIYSRWPGMQGFVFVLNILFDDLASWLSGVHPAGLIAAAALSWGAFALWWFHWQPAKYQTNFFLLSGQESQKILRERQGLWFSGHANSWLGSRLSGMPDGWRTICKRMALGAGMVLLFQIPLFLLFSAENFHEYLLYGSRSLLLLGVLVTFTFALGFYRNLHCIWLYSPGGRKQLFGISWWRFLRMTGTSLTMLFIVVLFLEIILGEWRGVTVWLLLAAAMFLFLVLLFHLLWFVYQQSQASISWWTWAGTLLLILWFYSLCATGLVFPLPFAWQGISPLWLFLPEIAALLLLHKRVRSGFSTMNLLRAV
ncbi:MAG: hypothetical protein B0W54_12170 [Cellvibrio sp. 79]|nr:MAG: hypothetical protein B0W54_12170 [Cellvibrio sp. 79]